MVMDARPEDVAGTLEPEPENRPVLLTEKAVSLTLTGPLESSVVDMVVALDPAQDDVNRIQGELLRTATGHVRRTGETVTVEAHVTYVLEPAKVETDD